MEAHLSGEARRHHDIAHLRDDVEARRERLLAQQRLAGSYGRVDQLAVCRGGRDDDQRVDVGIVDDRLCVVPGPLEGADRPCRVDGVG